MNYDFDENINDLELSIRKRSTLDIEDENGDDSVETLNSMQNPKIYSTAGSEPIIIHKFHLINGCPGTFFGTS